MRNDDRDYERNNAYERTRRKIFRNATGCGIDPGVRLPPWGMLLLIGIPLAFLIWIIVSSIPMLNYPF